MNVLYHFLIETQLETGGKVSTLQSAKQHMTYRTEVRSPVSIIGGNASALQNIQNNI